MSNKLLLSICIPTYNRALYLRECLNSIVFQDGFDDRVEIVISDNCSTDETENVCLEFMRKYSNIHYFRNEKNIRDANFPLSLRRGNGELRKLTNDTVIYKPGAIRYMLERIQQNLVERPQLYFLSSGKKNKEFISANNLEEYISIIGINLTWIRSFAIWEEDCKELGIFEEEAESQMAQVSFLLRNFQKHGNALICDRIIMDSLSMEKKNVSYGLFHVFYDSFLGFIKPYEEQKTISIECYEELRKKLLMEFFLPWIINQEQYKEHFTFSDENLRKLVSETYKNERYYPEFRMKLAYRAVKERTKKILKKRI